jgi:acyl-CoA synthetase (NDP forming)
VAIVGATDNLDAPAGRVQRYLAHYGFAGSVHPVNPKRGQVQGVPTTATVSDIGTSVDLAVVAVRASLVADALRDCAKAGVPAVVVLSSGFAEIGGEGVELEAELREIVARSPFRMIGPNTSGIVSVGGRAPLTFMTGLDQDRFELRDDGVAVISQSGAIGSCILNLAQGSGLGVGVLINTGNEADLTLSQTVDALLAEEPPRVILGYIEGIRDAAALLPALRRLAATSTMMAVVKVGRSEGGTKAVASHTGAITGADGVYDGVFRQFGVIRADSIAELADLGRVGAHSGLGAGGRLTVVTLSGGAGALAVDDADAFGLELATWDAQWQDRLQAVLPQFASVQNPIDVTGAIATDPGMFVRTLEIVGEHPGTDIVLVILGNFEMQEDELVEGIVRVTRSSSKSFVVAWIAGSGRPVEALNRAQIASFPDPSRAMRAVGTVVQAARLRAELVAEATPTQPPRRSTPRALGVETAALDEHGAKDLLREFGIPVVEEEVVSTIGAARKAAESLGYPVVVKLLSAELTHKTEQGGVITGVADLEALDGAFARLSTLGAELGLLVPRLLIQQQADGHLEVLLGMIRDDNFGPVVTIGLGGIFAELFSDTAVLVPPFGRGDAHRALASLRSREVFAGLRGKRPVDREALVSAICAFGAFVETYGDQLVEVDVNPLIVGGERVPIAAVDALIVFDSTGHVPVH